MSKSNATENDFVKFVFNAIAMPSYGASLQLNFHTADPLEDGVANTFKPTPTNYVAQTIARDGAGWVICDSDGTPNTSGSCAKNAGQITYPEVESGFVGTEEWKYGSVSVVTTGQILYSGALTQKIIVSALSVPIFPAGTVLFREE